MICCVYVYPFFFLNEAHVFLGLDHGLVVFEALKQLFLSQIVLVAGYKEVCEEKPRPLEMLSELELVVILQACLEVVSPVGLFLLNELAKGHADEPWDIIFVLGQEILQSLGSKLKVCFLLGVDHRIALNDGSVDAAIVQLCDQVLGSTDVVRSGGVLLLPSGLGHKHLIEGIEIDLDHIRDGCLSKEAVKSRNVELFQSEMGLTLVPVIEALSERESGHG